MSTKDHPKPKAAAGRHDIAKVTHSTPKGRNSTLSRGRIAIEATLAQLPRGKTMPVAEVADRVQLAERTVSIRLRQMRHDGLAVNDMSNGTIAQWRLTAQGRRALIGEEPAEPETETPEVKTPPNVASPRTWHSGSQATAPIGSLNPWAGVPVREGSLVAFSLPSKGIKA